MDHTSGQVFHAFLFDEDQEHRPDYVAPNKMAINSTTNASIWKVSFEVLYVEDISLPIDLLLSRESFINA